MTAARTAVFSALRGCMADVDGPVVQPGGGRADAVVIVGDRHLVALSVCRPGDVLRTARRLTALDLTGPMRGAVATVTGGQAARVLRVIAVAGRAPARPETSAVLVNARALARRLQESPDPDDVWLELAAGDRSTDGWLGAEAVPAGPTGLESWPRAPQRLPASLHALLLAARLPPLSRWQSVHTDPANGTVRLAAVDGPLLLFAHLPARTALVLPLSRISAPDRAFAQAVGQAVAADLARALGTPRPWRRPVVLALVWRPDLPPTGGFAECRAGRLHGAAAVESRGDLGMALAAVPDEVRRSLASAAADALGISSARAGAFVAAWQEHRFGLVVAPEVVAPALRGHDEPIDCAPPIALHRRALACSAAGRMPAGRYEDAAARRLVNHLLVPALLERLAALYDGLDVNAAVAGALGRLQAVLATHMRMSADHERALGGPWRAGRAMSGTQRLGRSLRAARAAELAVEAALLAGPGAGSGRPDRVDARLWEAAADSALLLALASQQSHAGLTRLVLDVRDDGWVDVDERPGDVPAAGYAALRRLVESAATADAAAAPSAAAYGSAGAEDEPFESLLAVGGGSVLIPLDVGLRAATGAGLDAFVAVLATAADLPSDADGVVRVRPGALAASAADWAAVPSDEAGAAVRALTLSRTLLRSGEFDFWRLEARQHRLATRPLVDVGEGQLLVAPARARATQILFARYLSDGRLPWADRETGTPVWKQAREAAAGLRAEANRLLERRLAERLSRAGLRVARNVRPLRKGLPFLPGEVDVLAADPTRRRLWLLEAKDARLPFSAVEISDDIGDIHGRRWPHAGRRGSRDEARRLADKAGACRERLTETLTFLGVVGAADGWTVHAVVVTPSLSPAAFVTEPLVLFAVADQIEDVVALDTLPDAGLLLLDPALPKDRASRPA